MYQPKIVPELVSKGCDGGFCIAPESLSDELRCGSAHEFLQTIEGSDIERELALLFFKYLEKTYLAVDKKVIDYDTIVLLLEQSLEIATLELICDVSGKAVHKFREKYGEIL